MVRFVGDMFVFGGGRFSKKKQVVLDDGWVVKKQQTKSKEVCKLTCFLCFRCRYKRWKFEFLLVLQLA